VHKVKAEDVIITDVFMGSCSFKYTLKDINELKKQLEDPSLSKEMKLKFETFQDLKIHPLLIVNAFDVNDFDERGHKDFTMEKSTFQVGPVGKEQPYYQPTGWTRYGLTVLDGRYGTDHTWLDPFQDPNNWYRAFHGTSFENSKPIFEKGFLPGGAQAYRREAGKGVYCSPKPNSAEEYSQTMEILCEGGKKQFKLMFQVCVNPYEVKIPESRPDYWVAPNEEGALDNGISKDNIRPYGILIKEC